jgi:hypothetical protein
MILRPAVLALSAALFATEAHAGGATLEPMNRLHVGASLADSRRINQSTSRRDAACGSVRHFRRVDEPPQRSQEDLDELCVRGGGSVVLKRRRAQTATLCVCSTRPCQLRSRVGVRKHDQKRGSMSFCTAISTNHAIDLNEMGDEQGRN